MEDVVRHIHEEEKKSVTVGSEKKLTLTCFISTGYAVHLIITVTSYFHYNQISIYNKACVFLVP